MPRLNDPCFSGNPKVRSISAAESQIGSAITLDNSPWRGNSAASTLAHDDTATGKSLEDGELFLSVIWLTRLGLAKGPDNPAGRSDSPTWAVAGTVSLFAPSWDQRG